MKRTAILIHAQFLLPGVWPVVMWGFPSDNKLGIISKGIQLAIEQGAYLVYLCSGIPKIGGREVSPDATKFLRAHNGQIKNYEQMTAEIVQDDLAQNTREEIENASAVLEEHDIDRVISVTAPKHAPRVLQELMMAKMNGLLKGIEISVAPSDVDFPGATAADIAILEAPHRHDSPPYRLDLFGRGIVEILRQGDGARLESFLRAFSELLKTHGATPTWENS